MKDTRVAVVVCNAQVGKIRQNIDKVAHFAGEARNNGADIVCFPEMNITGYSNRRDMIETAEPVPGPISRELLKISDTTQTLILSGLAEKGDNGRIHASHLVVNPDGELGIYRKLQIAPPEKEIYSPGGSIPVFSFRETTFGIQLCYDAHFPGLSTKMALKGAEILFFPHASPRGLAIEKHKSWMRHLTARAYDNSVFVIAYNQTGSNGKGLSFPGNAVAIDPAGNILKKYLSVREKMIMVDLKASAIDSVRNNRMHFFLPGNKPDL
jgi:N-carbamoylputrescine amidase